MSKRRINIPGQEKPSATSVASSMYEEVLAEIVTDCYHQYANSGDCIHCYRPIPNLGSDMCEVRVRVAINRLLAYQRQQIKKSLDCSIFETPGPAEGGRCSSLSGNHCIVRGSCRFCGIRNT